MAEQEIFTPDDMLNKLSQALIQVSRGDPLVALRNELQTQFRSIETRFAAIDKATELQHEDVVRVPTQVDKAIGGLRELLDQTMRTHAAEILGHLHTQAAETSEKFAGIKQQFSGSDTALAAAFKGNKDLIDAQNKANTDAADKSEKAFKEQISSLTTLMNTSFSTISKDLADLKTQATGNFGASKGAADNSTKLMAVVALAGMLLFGFYSMIETRQQQPVIAYTAPTVQPNGK